MNEFKKSYPDLELNTPRVDYSEKIYISNMKSDNDIIIVSAIKLTIYELSHNH